MSEKPNTVKAAVLSLKWWQAAILLAILLFGSGFAAMQGANVSVSLELLGRLDYLEVQQQLLNDTINIPVNSTVSAMVKEANYIIAPHGSYYCLINGTDDRGGRLEYFGTNKTLTEQYALANMTSGLVYMKDCTHTAGLTLTTTQMVQESYQGLMNVYGSKGLVIAGWINSTSTSITSLYLTNLYMTNGTSFGGAAGPAGTVYGLPFSYLVFKNSTATYMVNSTTSLITYYSINSSFVLNAVTGNLTQNGGGSVYVASGDYDIYTYVRMSNNTVWTGDGYTSCLRLAAGRDWTHAANWPNWCIFLTPDGDVIENTTIHNIRFDGNYANNNAPANGSYIGDIGHGISNIYLYGPRRILIDNIWSENGRVDGCTLVSHYREGYDNTVRNSYFFSNQWNGQSVAAGAYPMHDCTVEGNTYGGTIGDIAIDTYGTATQHAERITITYNTVEQISGTEGSSASAWYGIKLEWSTGCLVSYNKVTGVRMGIADDQFGYGNNTISYNVVRLRDVPSGSAPIGIDMTRGRNLIQGNNIYAAPTNGSTGIVVHGAYGGYQRIKENILINDGSGWFTGIQDIEGSTGNQFIGNDVSLANTKMNLASLTSAIVTDNIGFATEDRGVFSSVVNGTVISYVLASTANIVMISTTNETVHVWYGGLASDHFHVYFDVAGSISGSFMAIYKP